ncbi:MAG: hypothetical protein Q8K70_03620 [Bacteroidota bacterium]|nr:hypothetical protein [Bacteroidota bacterium]
MNKINTNLLFILALIFLIGCDKDPSKPGYQGKPPKPEYYRIKMNEELKSYLWSKPGSYWIYKNTKTGDLDTHIVNNFYFDSILVKGTELHTKHITIYYDYLTKSFYGTFIKRYFYEYSNYKSPNAESFNNGRNGITREGNGSINYPLYYPFVITSGPGTGNGSSYTTYIGMDSTLTIQGKTYQNVAKFDIDKDDIWEEKLNCIRSNNIYYWAKDVGLIKKQSISCNYSWELIEYNIIK